MLKFFGSIPALNISVCSDWKLFIIYKVADLT